MPATIAAQATSPTIQLQVAADPSRYGMPPPISLKFLSIGATVSPRITHQAAPRQTIRPPSVTMKDGMPA